MITMDERLARITHRRWALHHDCPRCKAEPNEQCFSMTGNSGKRVPPHAERIAAAVAWMETER